MAAPDRVAASPIFLLHQKGRPHMAPYDDQMICEFFCLNADFATKAQVNMVSLDLSMAAAQRRHTKGSIGLAYSLLPSRKRGQF